MAQVIPFDKDETKMIERIEAEVAAKYLDHLGLSPSFRESNWRNYQISDDNRQAIKIITEIQTSDPFGAFIYGPAGCGKTHLMKCLANVILDFKIRNTARAKLNIEEQVHYDLAWINLSEWISEQRAHHSTLPLLVQFPPDVLFIDDFGVSNRSEFVTDLIYQLLNKRLEDKKQTFITSNLNLDQIAEGFHERIASRIKALCIPVALKGADRRTNDVAKNLNQIKERIQEKGD